MGRVGRITSNSCKHARGASLAGNGVVERTTCIDTASVGVAHAGAGAMERDLIGGIVTHVGPLIGVRLEDREALSRLNLHPVFVGVERELLRATVNGDPSSIREALVDRQTSEDTERSESSGWLDRSSRRRGSGTAPALTASLQDHATLFSRPPGSQTGSPHPSLKSAVKSLIYDNLKNNASGRKLITARSVVSMTV